jgi:hypothetical protein
VSRYPVAAAMQTLPRRPLSKVRAGEPRKRRPPRCPTTLSVEGVTGVSATGSSALGAVRWRRRGYAGAKAVNARAWERVAMERSCEGASCVDGHSPRRWR